MIRGSGERTSVRRWRSAVLPILAAALVLGVGAMNGPAAAADGSRDRLAIGDSVMLGAKPALRDRGFRVDAATSRQAYSGPALLRSRGANLPTNIVIHLGTNGTFPLDTCRKLVRTAGPERRVFLVTVAVPRSWEDSNNAAIRRCAAAFDDGRVTVVDWQRQARQHRKWFYRDGIHLKPAGQQAFARLLDSAVDEAVRAAEKARQSAEEARQAALLSASGRGTAALRR